MHGRSGLLGRAVLVLGLVAASQFALAAQPNPTNRIHMTSKPAVVQVVAGWIAEWEWDGEQIQRGNIGGGTGFFIHPDGYILTNAHVVSDLRLTEEELQKSATIDVLGAFLEAAGRPVNEENVVQLAQLIDAGRISAPQLKGMRRINFVFLQSGKRFAFEIKTYGAPIGGEGDQVLTGKDVAVLKVEIKNAPTLKLGDSSNVQVGDPVLVMGYPAAAESDVLDERSELEPTTNEGKISAKKTSRDGTPLLQTSTAATHGNSGGPVLNEKGEVIGQLTFRGDTVMGQEVQGFNFIVPINTAMEFVRQAGTENKAGTVDEKWLKGLEQYWNEHYSLAKQSFADVVGLFPDHSEAQKLIAECAERIAKGEDKTPPPEPPKPATPPETPAAGPEKAGAGTSAAPTKGAPTEAAKGAKAGEDKTADEGFPTWAIAAIAGGGGLLVVVIILVVVLSGKKKGAPAGAPAPYAAAAGAPPPGYPGAPMPGAPMPGAPMPGAPMPGAPMPAGGPPLAGTAPTMASPSPPAKPGMVAKTELYQAPSTARLSCQIGPLQGREFPIGPGLYIGRDPARAQLVVNDSQVSGQHLWIGPAGGKFVVKDMGSTNGTYLNNRLDQRLTEATLNEGDQLALGQRGTVLFVFHA
jgi:hypothetical protein